ncbi:MAG TPA: hypothetical protein VEK08_05830 [Planctomycetota bacterium]|nr:hypothetical protein [Planctomycetota bacterium]
MLQFFLLAAQNLPADEQARVELWLSIFTGVLLFLIFSLLILAVLIRFIALRSTRPCRWCMEFISNKATVCPRCGKEVKPVDGPAASAKDV